MAKRNPPWTREELLLALDLFFKTNPSKFTASNPDVIELSNTLRRLSAYPNPPDIEKYRNPNGVAKKLSNFLRFDPTYNGAGLIRGGKLDQVVWMEFYDNKKLLKLEVKKTQEKLSDNTEYDIC